LLASYKQVVYAIDNRSNYRITKDRCEETGTHAMPLAGEDAVHVT
jgi:hypothetical protein